MGLRLGSVTIRNVGAGDVVLRKLRAAGVRPADLARALGISRPAASLMMSGKRGIATWHLDAIAGLLHVPVYRLFMSRENRDLDYETGGRGGVVSPTKPAQRVSNSSMTRSVLHPVVHDPLIDRSHLGESSHDHTAEAGTTADRLSESSAKIDAEVQHGIESERQAAFDEFVARLYASANDVRAVADALRTGTDPSTPRDDGSLPSGRRLAFPAKARRKKR